MAWTETIQTPTVPLPEDAKIRVFMRNGAFPLHLWSEFTCKPEEPPADLDLTEKMHKQQRLTLEGRSQVASVGQAIRNLCTVKVAFALPHYHALETADIAFGHHNIPYYPAPELEGRSLGVFAYQSAAACNENPHYRVDEYGTPKSDVLNWRPASRHPDVICETLQEVSDRMDPVLQRADEHALNGAVAFVAPADVMVAARAKLGSFTNDRLNDTLVALAPDDRPGLYSATAIQPAQADVYYWNNPLTGEAVDPKGPPSHFASFSTQEPRFHSGFMKLFTADAHSAIQ